MLILTTLKKRAWHISFGHPHLESCGKTKKDLTCRPRHGRSHRLTTLIVRILKPRTTHLVFGDLVPSSPLFQVRTHLIFIATCLLGCKCGGKHLSASAPMNFLTSSCLAVCMSFNSSSSMFLSDTSTPLCLSWLDKKDWKLFAMCCFPLMASGKGISTSTAAPETCSIMVLKSFLQFF